MSRATVTLLLIASRNDAGLETTLASAEAACKRAQAQGIAAVLRQVEPTARDWGTRRNQALRGERSQFVAFLEPGDLVSENWIEACVAMAQQPGAERWIFHPEKNLIFGAELRQFDSPDQEWDFNPSGLVWTNYWSPLHFARTEVFSKLPYPKSREGFGGEGWSWNCDAIPAGFVHRVVPETVHFLHEGSAHAQELITRDWKRPCLPSAFFGSKLAAQGAGTARRPPREWSESLLDEWMAASGLEPRLSLGGFAPPRALEFSRGELTPTFLQLLEELGDRPDYVFVIHQLRRGGSELEAIAHARALAQAKPGRTIRFMTTECSDADWINMLPAGARVVRFGRETAQNVSQDDQRRMLLKLLLQSQPQAIHVKHSWQCWDVLSACARTLRQFSRLYGSLYCIDYSSEGRPVSFAYSHLKYFSEELDAVFCDNQAMADHIRETCDVKNARVLRFPVLSAERHTRPPQRPKKGLRLLWASRIARQKNLDALFRIARACPNDEIHAFGEFSEYLPESWRKALTRLPNLKYFGSFDGLDSLDVDGYDALLYTSSWDGLPNILLEAGAVGLPILAPAVGGIPELIDEETGFLAQSEEDYLEHLEVLRSRPAEAERRVRNLRKVLASRHSFQTFYRELKSVPGYLS